ncbi:12084_t:CDS:2 [Funneliformis mosseae]|uniref:12084_t:CDS:1 n=1 Tax=Funneliformis mosseae TaxID=27381 RepID=A0A9N8ZSW5_FUNMO|nr:12084_t:CDS:2 [Funneliformis mosseae]
MLERIYSTNSKTSNFINRSPVNDGLEVYGFSSRGISFNRNYDSWAYLRKFFIRAVMTPSFVKQALVWSEKNFEEMEGYWKKLYGDDHNELDLSEWLGRLYTDNIFHITANKKVYALANYFNKLSPREKVSVDSTSIMERSSNETLTEPLTDEAIIGNFMETTAGGIDSITSSTCFISYFMAKYPEVKKRVFEEIDSKFTRDQKLTCGELNQLPYCDAVIREISRMHPIAELNYRVNAQEETFNGYVIPAETQIYIHQYAMMELKAYMVLMYRKYDFELVDKNAPLKTHYSIIRACDELKVRVKPRVF